MHLKVKFAILIGALVVQAILPATGVMAQSVKANDQKKRASELIEQSADQLNSNPFATQAPCQDALTLLTVARRLVRNDNDAFYRSFSPKFEAPFFSAIAGIHKLKAEYAPAIECYEESLKLYRKSNDHSGEASTLLDLAFVFKELSQPIKSIELYQQALPIYRELKDENGINRLILNIALTIDSNIPQAREAAVILYQTVLKRYRELKNRGGEADTLLDLGHIYANLANYDKSIEAYQQALPIYRELKNRNGEARVLHGLGFTYGYLEQYGQALSLYKQALPIYQALNDREGEGRIFAAIGTALFHLGNATAAEESLYKSIALKESAQVKLPDAYKISRFDYSQADTYRQLQQVLIAQNKSLAALELAERGRAKAFVELLSSKLSFKQTAVTQLTIDQIKQIAKIQNSTLVEYSIIYDNLKVKGQIEYKESKLYIWVIKPTGEVEFRSVDLNPLWQQQNTDLEKIVASTRVSIGARGRGLVGGSDLIATSPEHLQQLHKLLIEPIADILPTNPNDRVTFIPQQFLFLVPFPALQDIHGKYLIEKHTILSAPSTQVLDLTHQQRQRVSGKDALVMGNPTMPSYAPPGKPPEQLLPLPESEKEATSIASVLHTTAITGSLATKNIIVSKMLQARFIHLATHGLLDDVKGLGVPGAIALAPSGKDDGLLRADEILDLKLNAELVVLSACNTGRGTITGDGVIGLSRSLITAGVPSVIVSLWSVPDDSTSLLMTEFYKNLQHKSDKAAALRGAMLTTMKQHPSPKYWAAFTLIGESE